MTRSLTLCFLLLVFVLAIGCSGSGTSPVTPTPDQNDELELTGSAQAETPPSGPTEGHSLLGYWSCLIDPEDGTVEFVPLRGSQFHFNLVSVLEGGTMNISLVDKPSFSGGVLHVNIALQHPFPGKLNLSGFDVKGILITEGSKTGFIDGDIRIAGPTETRLLNADGFTRWWNPAEFLNSGLTGYNQGSMGTAITPDSVAILNGYKLYADGLGMEEDLSDLDPASRAFFEAGESNSRHYEISLAGGVRFNYAVDCSWAAASPNPPVNVPDDFPPEANQAAPWFIEVDEYNNTLWYADGSHGGNLNYSIAVHDWQDISEISGLLIEIPGIFVKNAASPDSTVGNTAYYHFNVIQPNLTSAGPLDVLITVAVPGDYIPSMTGVDKPLRAYHRHISQVSNEEPVFNLPPVALMEAVTATEIPQGGTVRFDASASYDPDGIITSYLWDFNGDSVYGDPFTGNSETPIATFDTPGTFEVKVKVNDDSTGSTTSDPVTVTVSVGGNIPPVPVAEATTPTHILEDNTISFDGSASYDPDGFITTWAWDFNGDGVFNDPYEGDSQTPTAMFANPGTFYVDLKVFDNEGGSGTLFEKIEVIIDDVPNVGPTANAVATTPADINACGSVTFDASGSVDPDGYIDSYQWDFDGNGTYGDTFNSGNQINPTKVYNTPGTYDVMLRVTDDEDAEDTIDTPITVTVTNIGPTANAVATSPTGIFTTQTVAFSAASAEDPDCDDIVLYEWDFDGDGIYGDTYESGTYLEPVKTYPDKGIFNVNLRVVDGLGAEDETDAPIVVTVTGWWPIACAEITSGLPYEAGTDIYFSGSCSDDPDGTVQTYEWDLGADGSYENTGETTSYYFGSWGYQEIQLRVTDNDSDQDLLDQPLGFWIVDADHHPPIVTQVNHSRTTSERGNDAEAVSLSVDFTDAAPPGDTHTYLWSCDYGSFDNDTSATPTWYPPSEVVKCDITVQVTDNDGMWGEGTCRQWVTRWPVLTNNPNATDGCMIISRDLEDCLSTNFYDPADFIFPDIQPNGNVVYINWWAEWCYWCDVEMPNVEIIYNMYLGEDYVHLLINKADTKSVAAGYINDNDYHATYWLWDPASGDTYFNLTNDWNDNSTGIPQHLVFDRDGRCRGNRVGSIVNTGIEPIDRYLRELI